MGSSAVHGALIGKSLPLELETWLQMIRTFWTLQSKVEDSLKITNSRLLNLTYSRCCSVWVTT